MTTKRYRLTVQAETDVSEIWVYIGRDNIVAADNLIDRFTELFQRLAVIPGMGSQQDRYRSGLRCFPVDNYLIFYSVTDYGIEVFRVLHGARQFEDLL